MEGGRRRKIGRRIEGVGRGEVRRKERGKEGVAGKKRERERKERMKNSVDFFRVPIDRREERREEREKVGPD